MQTLTRKIELFFWDYTISLLSTSELARTIIRHIYHFKKQYLEGLKVTSVVSACGMMGLVVGIILGRLINNLN
jgi:hypothetical protein